MGDVVRLRARHVTSAGAEGAGRGTPAGQATSSGHRSENQTNTSSYLRAVKVLAPSSSRSKNRQSPAAKRPTVAMLTARAKQYAEAQVIRFERNSDSMASENSRKIPTLQANSVGKFRLAEKSDKSDKSAMPTVEQIRRKIQKAMQDAGDGAVALAVKWGLERNDIRDFLVGKKRSLNTATTMAISEKYGIPLNELVEGKDKKPRHAANR